jgi:hypothetical protein
MVIRTGLPVVSRQPPRLVSPEEVDDFPALVEAAAKASSAELVAAFKVMG